MIQFPLPRGMIGNRAGWAAWLLILVGRRSIRLVLGDEGVSVSTGSSIDQETDAGVRYARAMGTALLGLLGDRPAIHMRDCNTPNRIAPKSAFRARWQQALTKLEKPGGLRHCAELFDREQNDPSRARWIVPCWMPKCNTSEDLLFPPFPETLRADFARPG